MKTGGRAFIASAIGLVCVQTAHAMSDATYIPNNAADTSAPGVRSAFPEPVGVFRPTVEIGQIAIKTVAGKLPADGSSRVPVEIEILDRHGELLKTPINIALDISADVPVHLFGVDGAPLHDSTGERAGILVEVRNGRASLLLQSPGVAGEVAIRASVASGLSAPAGNAVWTQQKVVFAPDLRSLIAVGLAEARVSRETTTAEVRPPPGMRDQYSQDLTHWSTALRTTQRDTTGRTAFFVKGTVAEKTLLTASFDSEKDRRARQMQNVSAESLYPIYGDEAEIGFDAVSSSQLYLRIDREAMATGVTIQDRLPAGFRLEKRTTKLLLSQSGAVTSGEPAVSAGGVRFEIGNLAGGATAEVTYSLRVGVGAKIGTAINRARAASSNGLSSSDASVSVEVTAGVFTDDGCIAGKVFVDTNGDGIQSQGEPGIARARVYLQNGMHFTTDWAGRYSFCGVKSRSNVVKLDKRSVPAGCSPKILSNANMGDAGSIFLGASNGHLQRGDFAVTQCSPSAIQEIEKRNSSSRATRSR